MNETDFLVSAMPALRRMALAWAWPVAMGMVAYSEALDGLCLEALRRGGSYLEDFDGLEERLAKMLADFAEDISNRR